MRAGILVMAIGVAPVLAHRQAALDDGWRADLEQFAQSLVQSQLVPAIGLAVTQGDRVVYSQAFGLADASSGRRADERTAFYIASSTKALTATAVLALNARKVLDLDASVVRYLPALRGAKRLSPESVSLRDLLTMSHGLEGDGAVEFRTAYSGTFSPQLLLELLGEYRQTGPPRPFRYGNLGYNILGLVLDSRRPDGWKSIVRREVLEPLGMHETSARVSDFEPHAIALPHEYGADGRFRRIRLAKADDNMHAAGGHFATARDLARFVAAHASGGRLNGVQVFPREMVASAHDTQIAQDRRSGPFHRFGWGYGWDVSRYGGEHIVHRFGGFSGYRSHMSFMSDRGTGVVVLVNGSGVASSAADLMATYVYDRLSGLPDIEAAYKLRLSDLRALAEAQRYNLAQAATERQGRIARLPRPLHEYAGAYENGRFGRMEWRVVGTRLEARMGIAVSEAEVFDAGKNQVRIDVTGDTEVAQFAFVRDDGAARAVTYRGEIFQRVGR